MHFYAVNTVYEEGAYDPKKYSEYNKQVVMKQTIVDNKTVDVVDNQKTSNVIKNLNPKDKEKLYSTTLKEFQNMANTITKDLKGKVKSQLSDQVDEQNFDLAIKFMVINDPNVEPPFKELPTIEKAEKQRRKTVQKRAYELFTKKEPESLMCRNLGHFFAPIQARRSTQVLFMPKELNKEEMDKSLGYLELWRLHLENEKKRELGEDDYDPTIRQKMIKTFQDRITDAIKGGQEIISAQTDEEFVKAMEKNYYCTKILAEIQPSAFRDMLADLDLKMEDLSPDFVELYEANREQSVMIGSINSRLSALASPLYPMIGFKDFSDFTKYVGDNIDDIPDGEARLKRKLDGVNVASFDNTTIDIFKGYSNSLSYYRTTLNGETVRDGLKSLTKKFLNSMDYKACTYLDKDGNVIPNYEQVEAGVINGDEIYLQMPNGDPKIPIVLDDWNVIRQPKGAFALNTGLSSVSQKIFGTADFNTLTYVNKNGEVISNIDQVKSGLINKEEIFIQVPNGISNVPLVADDWGVIQDPKGPFLMHQGLTALSQKFCDTSDYKSCKYVDRKGNVIENFDQVVEKIMNKEEVSMLAVGEYGRVPIIANDIGIVQDQNEVQLHVSGKEKVQSMIATLSAIKDHLPEKDPNTVDNALLENNKMRLNFSAETITKNMLDMKKVKLHERAVKITQMRGTAHGGINSSKSGVQKEMARLEEKYGPIPSGNRFMSRIFSMHLKTDGSQEAIKFNETMYRAYQQGTDEPKEMLQNTIREIMNLDLNELNQAIKSFDTALDYYEKHFVTLETAHDMVGTVSMLPGAFSDEFRDFVNSHVTFFDTISMIRDHAALVASDLFFADVYDEPAFKDPNTVSAFSSNIPNGQAIMESLATNFQYDEQIEKVQKLADLANGFDGNFLAGAIIGHDESDKRYVQQIQTDGSIIDKEVIVGVKYVHDEPIPKSLNVEGLGIDKRDAEQVESIFNALKMSGQRNNVSKEYRARFNEEIRGIGINGAQYDTLSEFFDNNKGGIFNRLFGTDSAEYKNLVVQAKLFERKLTGDDTAFPENRQDAKMKVEDYQILKDSFDAYIAHKERQLKDAKKTEFKLESTEDHRYKFAKKMSEILETAIICDDVRVEKVNIKGYEPVVENRVNLRGGNEMQNELENDDIENDDDYIEIGDEEEEQDGLGQYNLEQENIDLKLQEKLQNDYNKGQIKSKDNEKVEEQTMKKVKDLNNE